MKKNIYVVLLVLFTMLGMYWLLNIVFADDEIIPIDWWWEPLPVVCGYPAPPVWCTYRPWPMYNAMTNCGMELSCSGFWGWDPWIVPYTVTLFAGSWWTLTWDTVQNIWSESASPVTAVANSWYVFVNWSNWSTANPLNPWSIDNPSYTNFTLTAHFSQALLYTDPLWVYSFYYPVWLQYKNPATAWTVGVVLTRLWDTYASLSPIITVAKWPSSRSLSQVVAWVTSAYRRLFRNNYTLTTEIERTAHWVPTKQIHITGKIAWVDRTYIISFIRLLSKVYVV